MEHSHDRYFGELERRESNREQRVRLYQRSIQEVARTHDSVEKDDILGEIEADLEHKYQLHQITMQDRLQLIALLAHA